MAFYHRVGSNIRSRRKALNLSQEELATRISISRVSLTNIENGQQKLSLYRFMQIADALNTPIDSLIVERSSLESWLQDVGSEKQ